MQLMTAISDTYKALGDESRLRVLQILSHGAFNVQELTSILGISQSTISHHLKTLMSVSLVSSHKEGTWAYYSLSHQDTESLAYRTAKLFLDLAANKSNETDSSKFLKDSEAAKKILERRRDQTRHFFESVADKWKDIRAEAQGAESFFELVIERIPPQATLLELGCGAGAFFERILPRSGKSIGVDYSQAMLDQARTSLKNEFDSLDLRLGYLEHLPVGDESIDYALAYMVMHHIANPSEALKDAARVLKPEGKLLIVDLLSHNNEYMRERFADLWLGFDPEEMKRWAFKNHFTEAKLEILGQKKEVFMLTLTKSKGK